MWENTISIYYRYDCSSKRTWSLSSLVVSLCPSTSIRFSLLISNKYGFPSPDRPNWLFMVSSNSTAWSECEERFECAVRRASDDATALETELNPFWVIYCLRRSLFFSFLFLFSWVNTLYPLNGIFFFFPFCRSIRFNRPRDCRGIVHLSTSIKFPPKQKAATERRASSKGIIRWIVEAFKRKTAS